MAHSSNDIEKFFPIINCIEKSEQGVKDARGCVESGGLNWSDVETCANGTQGLLHFSFLYHVYNICYKYNILAKCCFCLLFEEFCSSFYPKNKLV